MTAKEEATALIYKYRYLVTIWDCYNDCDIKIKDRLPDMIKCAVITVDQIIEALTHNLWQNLPIIDHYTEVKQEIENYDTTRKNRA